MELAVVRSETVMSISDKVRRAIISAYSGKCQYCGQVAEPAHIDHIVARANGGADDLLNFTLACESCNLRKTALRLPVAYEGLLLAIAEQKLSAVVANMNAMSRSKPALKIVEPPKILASHKFLCCSDMPAQARLAFFKLGALIREGATSAYGDGCKITDPRIDAMDAEIEALQDYKFSIYHDTPRGPRFTGMLRFISGTMHECKDGTSWEKERLVEVNATGWMKSIVETYRDADLNEMIDAGFLPYRTD